MNTVQIKISLDDIPADMKEIVIRIDNEGQTKMSNTTKTDGSDTVFTFINELANQLDNTRQRRTAETYRTTLNSFRRFRNGLDMTFGDFNSSLFEDYEAWLKSNHVCLNTVAFYMRRLRAAYNRAIDRGLATDCKPFRNVYTRTAKTEKRAIGIDDMRLIKNYKPTTKGEEFARDMFLFSFYTRGMALVDIANLKRTDIKNGRMAYRRRKTGQLIQMEWDERMQGIIDRHPSSTGVFLLPLISEINGKEFSQFRYRQYLINCNLKAIGDNLGFSHKLTFYTARHSWATIANTLNIPLNIISQGMGHDSENTTRIYLKSLDAQVIDQANQQVMHTLD